MATDRLVTVRPGTVVPLGPVLYWLALQARGLRLSRDGSDLIVSPCRLLDRDDDRRIRRWKPFLLALVSLETPEVPQWRH